MLFGNGEANRKSLFSCQVLQDPLCLQDLVRQGTVQGAGMAWQLLHWIQNWTVEAVEVPSLLVRVTETD
jgi:hypothetical protein